MSVSVTKRDVTVRQPERQRAPDRSWTVTFVLSLLWIAPVVALVVLVDHPANRISRPSDQELTATFLSHEADFEELARMLDADGGRLSLAEEALELADLGRAGASATRIGHYVSVLRKINATNFRYFPRCGTIIVPVSERSDSRPGSSKSYRYLPRGEPQSLAYHPVYGWRGPGMYILTEDRRIKGQWFVHHDTTIAIGVSPY
jgi:hypothetical protein